MNSYTIRRRQAKLAYDAFGTQKGQYVTISVIRNNEDTSSKHSYTVEIANSMALDAQPAVWCFTNKRKALSYATYLSKHLEGKEATYRA